MIGMAEFFAFYWNGILRFLHWFTDPEHLFGLLVFGFPLVSVFMFLVSCLVTGCEEDVPFYVFGVLAIIGFILFFVLGIPFLFYLDC